VATLEPVVSTDTPSSTSLDQDAPSPSILQTPQELPSHVIPLGFKEADHDIDELVSRPDRVMIIALKWIYKVKLDKLGGVLKNKARLVVRVYHQEEGIDFEETFASVHNSRPFKFSKGTVDPTLFIRREGMRYSKDSCIALTTFADADHAGYQDTRRSTFGNEFVDPENPNHVYKLKKVLYGLNKIYGLGMIYSLRFYSPRSSPKELLILHCLSGEKAKTSDWYKSM
nr:hypothetical protein [Tanacetum cinerariifolium]